MWTGCSLAIVAFCTPSDGIIRIGLTTKRLDQVNPVAGMINSKEGTVFRGPAGRYHLQNHLGRSQDIDIVVLKNGMDAQ
ncbi:hypothetical protein MLD38_033410 [Melastoma candidum]|uniref:Uncharacterized protein n=1 Tax=Melastoma candidum TaxID=119954 RepID=A0ACB9MAE4_9MYRT|nr:hypothetical protein MLD38_033410 [Melastoma candidum]